MRRLLFFALILVVLVMSYPFLAGYLATRPDGEELKIRLYRHDTGQIEVLGLNEYVTGVVAAEMPAGFPAEALKAQAVAARTYVLRRLAHGGVVNNPHPGSDVCDDYRHAQAWLSREELKERWGLLNYYRYYYKIRKAVQDTGTTVITYQGELIDPVYHSACGGRTEDAGAVWKDDVPYLKSVACPYEADPRSEREVAFTAEQLEQALGVGLTVPVAGGQSPVQITARTGSGRVAAVRVGSAEFRATVLRERLGLRSTNFNCRLEGDRVVFTTVGYGHGVGLCQYGAKGMAENGYNYRQILKHYYTGIQLQELR